MPQLLQAGLALVSIFMAMFKGSVAPNPFKIFYLVFAYIVVFSIWWAYLLYAKNETAFLEKVELNRQQFLQQHPLQNYTSSNDYAEILNKHNRQRLMIITEGTVFIVLLLVGLVVVRRVFMREMELAAQQRNFLLSVTHELKSPLSSIKASLQTFQRRKLDAEQADKLVNNSLSDLDRLQALVENILFAARIEKEQPDFSNENTDVSEVVLQMADKFSANKKNIAIQADIAPAVFLKVDRLWFTSVVINLIENAIKYSPRHSVIRITLKQTEGAGADLLISDEGCGVPVEEREKVFEKFYRVGNEDTRREKGTGLGLYIVKRFAQMYGGTITLSDNIPAGSVFHLHLPGN